MAVDRLVPTVPPSNTTFAYAQARLQEEITALWQHVVIELASSGVNAISGASVPPLTSYADGKYFMLTAPATNTGGVTLNIDGLGPRALVSATNTPLAAGDLVAGQTLFVYFDNSGNTFRMASGGAPAVPVTYATGADVVAGTDGTMTVSPAAMSGAGVVVSGGAADAGKYVRTDGTGLVDDTLVPKATSAQIVAGAIADRFITPAGLAGAATDSSAGAADAGKFIQLDAAGKLDPSLLGLDVMEYKGTVVPTAAAPAAPNLGDVYVVSAGGTMAAGWAGVAGTALQAGDQLIYNGTTWDVVGGAATTTLAASAISTVPAGNLAATNAQAALAELDAEKVAKSGDTMTGPLVLPADPTLALQAATKQYVDAASVFTPSGNIAATTVAAAIAELDAEKVAKSGDTMTGPLVLSADPTLALQAATKQYVDAASVFTPSGNIATTTVVAAIAELDAEKVAKSGDTMTGPLVLSADPTVALGAATKQYVDALNLDDLANVTAAAPATNDFLQWDGTAWVAAALTPGGPVAASGVSFVAGGNIAATNVQAALSELDADKLALAGGTMTGAIAMGANAITGLANPTAAQDAATKSYVDTAVAFTPSGNIAATTVAAAVAELDAEKVAKSGDTMTGPLVLPADPTLALQAATKQYVDTKVAGPATSTDNAIARWDGATGKLIQDSGVYIDDTGRTGFNQASPVARVDVNGNYAQSTGAAAGGACDCSTSNYFTATVGAATTISFASVPAGRTYSCTVEVNFTAGSLAWPAAVKWPGGTAPTLTAGKTSLFMLVTSDAGATWYATSLTDY